MEIDKFLYFLYSLFRLHILIICYGVNIDQVSANIINKVYIKMMLQHLQHGNTKNE